MTFIIKKNIKRIICRACSLFPARFKVGGTRILMYHSIGGSPFDHRIAIRVPPANFKGHLDEILRMGYSTLTVSEFLERMASADIGKSIVITFDDGYKDNMTEAAVLLKERGMKATFFVTTSYIDKSVKKAWTDGSDRKYMDWKDIIELVRMGFEIGSHMVEHVNLAIQNDEKLIFQFEGSKKRIADMTGHEPRVFSYPYGNVDERVVNVARKAGYVGGCSSFTGINGSNVSPYLLKRTEIDGYDTIKDFRAKLSGWYD